VARWLTLTQRQKNLIKLVGKSLDYRGQNTAEVPGRLRWGREDKKMAAFMRTHLKLGPFFQGDNGKCGNNTKANTWKCVNNERVENDRTPLRVIESHPTTGKKKLKGEPQQLNTAEPSSRDA